MKFLMRLSEEFKTWNISPHSAQNSLRIASLDLEKKPYFKKLRQYGYVYLISSYA